MQRPRLALAPIETLMLLAIARDITRIRDAGCAPNTGPLLSDHRSKGALRHGAQEDPIAMVGSGAELPSSVEDVATLHRTRHARAAEWRRDPRFGVVAPNLLLHTCIRESTPPWVDADDPGGPTGCGIKRGCSHHRLGELPGGFEAAVQFGLHRSNDSDGFQRLHLS